MQQDAVLDMPAHRARQHHFLQIASLLDQLLQRVAMANSRNVLLNDRPVIEHLRDLVRGRPDELHAALKRLVVRLRTHERGQKRMMDVDDLLRILLGEIS
jgi:hypothetical protein